MFLQITENYLHWKIEKRSRDVAERLGWVVKTILTENNSDDRRGESHSPGTC